MAASALAACATGRTAASVPSGSPAPSSRVTKGVLQEPSTSHSPQAAPPAQAVRLTPSPRSVPPNEAAQEDSREPLAKLGWPDGVGDGRVGARLMQVSYFQELLAQAGIPLEVLPKELSQTTPEEAARLVPYLVASPATLGSFGPKRMAAHLLREVAEGAQDVLHMAQMGANGAGGNGPPKPDVGEGPRVVGLRHLLERDSSLREVLDLPEGWEAERTGLGAPWVRRALP